MNDVGQPFTKPVVVLSLVCIKLSPLPAWLASAVLDSRVFYCTAHPKPKLKQITDNILVC